jgi:hypothetical protein
VLIAFYREYSNSAENFATSSGEIVEAGTLAEIQRGPLHLLYHEWPLVGSGENVPRALEVFVCLFLDVTRAIRSYTAPSLDFFCVKVRRVPGDREKETSDAPIGCIALLPGGR